jgi:hypothetical protein
MIFININKEEMEKIIKFLLSKNYEVTTDDESSDEDD